MKRTWCAAIAAFGSLGLVGGAAAQEFFDVEVHTERADGYSETFDFIGHEFGTSATDGPGGPGGAFTFTFQTGSSADPAWDYELVMDYGNYDIGFFSPHATAWSEINMTNLGGSLAVADAAASYGSLNFTGDSIFWTASVQDILANGEVATINWSTSALPAPGALALLGVAGLFGTRRRRA